MRVRQMGKADVMRAEGALASGVSEYVEAGEPLHSAERPTADGGAAPSDGRAKRGGGLQGGKGASPSTGDVPVYEGHKAAHAGATAEPRHPNAAAAPPLFTPGFAAIVAAQVFSLLGMEILQFVLPLHLLNLTGSGALYGAVIAAGFVPYTLLSPMGGVLADRTRKRGVMAALDALLACLMVGYLLVAGSPHLVAATVAVLMVAFAAQALYQPCVQSAVPHVVAPERLQQAVAVTNQVSMVTGIGGPVVGGMVFGFCGLAPIVLVSAASFAVSSALVLARVRVPYEPPERERGPIATAVLDLRASVRYLRSKPIMWQIVVAATFVNLFGSSFFNVGSPYIVTESLGLSNQHLGLLQAVLAAGGLAGGMLVALRPHALGIERTPRLFALLAAGIGLIGLALVAAPDPLAAYGCLLALYAATMVCCMAGSIVATAYLQAHAPGTMMGKVMALTMMFANMATPVGQVAYGIAFDIVPPWCVAAIAALAVAVVAALLARAFGHEG